MIGTPRNDNTDVQNPNENSNHDVEAIENENIRTFSTRKKFSLKEKDDLAKLITKFKKGEDKNKVYKPNNNKRFKRRDKEGPISKALRQFYVDLKDKTHEDKDFNRAWQMAKRCLKKYENPKYLYDGDTPLTKRYRSSGAGRKAAAPEIRDSLFEYFIGK